MAASDYAFSRTSHSFAAMCLNFRVCMGEFDNQGI